MKARPLYAPLDLPQPDPGAVAISGLLIERIRERISESGGWLDFEAYMDMALYQPGLGYYPAGSVKIGAAGDFVTAPELSPLFGACLARQIGPLLRQLTSPVILELGGGTGALAAVLLGLVDEGELPGPSYWLLEPSPDLAERQRTELADHNQRVRWLDRLPDETFEGVIIANEVADALPVRRFQITDDGPKPLGVIWEEGLATRLGERTAELDAAVNAIQANYGVSLPVGYWGEFCPRLRPWLRGVSRKLNLGGIWIIDYGLPGSAHYHPQHTQGRFVCHYRHRQHDDPLWFPGLCDLSAWVDFSDLARGAREADLQVSGFTTQAQWLTGTGVLELAADPHWEGQAGALSTLLLPGEMGERFKVLTLTKGVDLPPVGRDMRRWL